MTPQLAVETALAEPIRGQATVVEAPAPLTEAPAVAAPSLQDPPVATLADESPAVEHAVVAVVGLGYVGLPTAIAMRNAGCRIVGIDVSVRRLDAIRDGRGRAAGL